MTSPGQLKASVDDLKQDLRVSGRLALATQWARPHAPPLVAFCCAYCGTVMPKRKEKQVRRSPTTGQPNPTRHLPKTAHMTCWLLALGAAQAFTRDYKTDLSKLLNIPASEIGVVGMASGRNGVQVQTRLPRYAADQLLEDVRARRVTQMVRPRAGLRVAARRCSAPARGAAARGVLSLAACVNLSLAACHRCSTEALRSRATHTRSADGARACVGVLCWFQRNYTGATYMCHMKHGPPRDRPSQARYDIVGTSVERSAQQPWSVEQHASAGGAASRPILAREIFKSAGAFGGSATCVPGGTAQQPQHTV